MPCHPVSYLVAPAGDRLRIHSAIPDSHSANVLRARIGDAAVGDAGAADSCEVLKGFLQSR